MGLFPTTTSTSEFLPVAYSFKYLNAYKSFSAQMHVRRLYFKLMICRPASVICQSVGLYCVLRNVSVNSFAGRNSRLSCPPHAGYHRPGKILVGNIATHLWFVKPSSAHVFLWIVTFCVTHCEITKKQSRFVSLWNEVVLVISQCVTQKSVPWF